MNLKSNFFYTLLCNVFYQIKVKYYFLKVKLYTKLNKKIPQLPVCFSEKDLKKLTKI
jgi:hypothetical protein